MNRKRILFILSLPVTLFLSFLLVSCPSQISEDILLQAKDEIGPVITILSPKDGDYYASNVFITGTVKDSSGESGNNHGSVTSLSYQVLATSIEGEASFNNESFSFVFSTKTLSGNITILITAVDWNGNKTEKHLTLVDGGNDIPSLTADAQTRSITLSWDPIPGATGYTLYYTKDGSYPNLPEGTNGYALSNIQPGYVLDTYRHDGDPDNTDRVKNGRMHVFRLRAHFPDGMEDSWSDYVKAIPLSELTLAPKVSKDLFGRINVWWHDIPAEVGYILYRAESKVGPYYQLSDTLLKAEYTDTNVSDGITYFYKVKPEKYSDMESFPMPGRTTTLDFSHTIGGLDLGSSSHAITLVGDLAYMGTGSTGLNIVDVSTPSQPSFITSTELSMSITGIGIKNGYAYVAAHAKPFYVFDINIDPLNPPAQLQKVYEENLPIWAAGTDCKDIVIDSEKNFLYLTNYQHIYVFDISVPANPVWKNRLDMRSYIDFSSQLFIKNTGEFTRRAYICGCYTDKRGLAIVDIDLSVATPTITHKATYSMDTAAKQVQVAGDYAYIASDEGLVVLDVSNPPDSFSNSFTLEYGRVINDLVITGNTLYALVLNKGICRYRIPDLFDHSGIFIEHIYDEILSGYHFYIAGDYAYISNPLQGDGGLSVVYTGDDFFDLSDRPAITFDEYGEYRGVTDVDIYDDTVFCTVRGEGLETLRLTPPATLQRLESFKAQASCLGVKVVGDLAFIADSNYGLRIVNVKGLYDPEYDPADPEYDPAEIGSVQAAWGGRAGKLVYLQVGLDVVGDYVFLPNFDGGILVIDASDPENPEKITVVPMTSDTIEVVAHHRTLYAAAYSSGLFAIDITSPENPAVLSNYYEGGEAMGLDVDDEYVYLAAFDRSVDIIDFSDPAWPVTVGQYDWPVAYNEGWIVCAMDVDAVGDYMYVSQFENGVMVIDISDPHYPYLQGGRSGQRKTSTVMVYDDYLYATGITSNNNMSVLAMYHIQTAQ